MKEIASLLVAFSAGALGYALLSQRGSRPRSDFATEAFRTLGQRLVVTPNRWVVLYRNHLLPIWEELPPHPSLDFPLFLALHLIAGPVPYLWLKHQQHRFHTALMKALPDYLDLQALVLEAGLDFNAGLLKYLEKGAASPLKPLMRVTHQDIQLGRSRGEAFAALARRTTFKPLRHLCRGIVQALALGTSLAPMFREQATALRLKRMYLAEKKAAEAPLKVLFPLFVFIFPPIFIVLLGPVALMFMNGGF